MKMALHATTINHKLKLKVAHFACFDQTLNEEYGDQKQHKKRTKYQKQIQTHQQNKNNSNNLRSTTTTTKTTTKSTPTNTILTKY